MTNQPGPKDDESMGEAVQNLLVSTTRFSAALALYGLEQLQTLADTPEPSRNLTTALERLRTMLDSLTDSLVPQMNETKRETMLSVSTAARYVIRKSVEIVSPAPSAAISPKQTIPNDAPRLAVDVLKGGSLAP